MKISVVVATRDRPELLDNCLGSIYGNDYNDYEVIVVDSSEVNAEKVKHVCKKHGAMYVHAAQANKSEACNIGINEANGEVLAFTDDDCIVPSDWLQKIGHFFLSKLNISCVVGRCIHPHAAKSRNKGPYPRRLCFFGNVWKKFDIPGSGANMAVLKKAAKEINGFDENLGPGADIPAAEDIDFSIRILKSGLKLLYDPHFTVDHLRSDWSWQHLSTWEIGNAYVFLKHRILYKYFNNVFYSLRKDLRDLQIYLCTLIKYLAHASRK